MSRTIIIGDVHGMLAELHALIKKMNLTMTDVLVSAGDLLDKGPNSAEVVQYMRSLREEGFPVVLVEGNHEEKHRRFRKAVAASPGKLPNFKGVDQMVVINEGLSAKDVAFLESAVLYHPLPEHGALVVHAGVLPDMETLPTLVEVQALSRGEREKLNRVLRVRHVTGTDRTKITLELEVPGDVAVEEGKPLTGVSMDGALVVKKSVRAKGSFVTLGDETPDDPFWADVYDGRFGHIFFGHNPYPTASEPMPFPHATGLDLGCVFGNRLAAAVLEVGKPTTYVTVPAAMKFAEGYWEE